MAWLGRNTPVSNPLSRTNAQPPDVNSSIVPGGPALRQLALKIAPNKYQNNSRGRNFYEHKLEPLVLSCAGSTAPGSSITVLPTSTAGQYALFISDPNGYLYAAAGNTQIGWGDWTWVAEGQARQGPPSPKFRSQMPSTSMPCSSPVLPAKH
jgi:hypothetical protein